jgi:nucleoside-diphosphate-sugar epimerase
MSKQIAILGANSEIAHDLILNWIEAKSSKLFLFSRDPSSLKKKYNDNQIEYNEYTEFCKFKYDVIINCIGAGNPEKVFNLNDSIIEITLNYDKLVLEYLNVNNSSLYIFLSSGAVYGESFDKPVNIHSKSIFTLNSYSRESNYAIAKFLAEMKHRHLNKFSIIDIRIFNYFSATQAIESKYLIMDIVRAIRGKNSLEVSAEDFVRDYIHPKDFFNLLSCIISRCKNNQSIDCFSKNPIRKVEILKLAKEEFGLDYKISDKFISSPTGSKFNYYSLNHSASIYGYIPAYSSLDSIRSGLRALL